MTDINLDELIAEARSLSTYEGSTLERAADALERLRVERDEWKASANEWADALADAADERDEALAVIERIGAMAENDDAAAWDAHQELIRLVARSAPADSLRAVKAEAWDEGAVWAAIECGAIRHEAHRFLAPGDNPYREGVA